ncbi:MAG: hypothetical protein ACREQQ_00950 [Candidatus Binatia bacterium]
MIRHRIAFGLLTLFILFLAVTARAGEPVGLSLLFQNGAAAPLRLVDDPPRHLQELDIVATVASETDRGIDPVIEGGDLAGLDWTGVEMVEEDWRSPGDGTWTRQRFYRGAVWMNRASEFELLPVDSSGHALGEPLVLKAGTDDFWDQSVSGDDGFVRRFVARQTATGCPLQGNCSGAKFTAQALVQVRDALHAGSLAKPVPAGTARLELRWNVDPLVVRAVDVTHVARADALWGYGFEPALELVDPPLNGSYFLPGEIVKLRMTFRDGDGNRLHPPGMLPTYGQFIRGEIASGLQYYDGIRLGVTTYYAMKHREANLIVSLSGPTDRLRTPRATVGAEQLLFPELVSASTLFDGFTSVAQLVPFGLFFGYVVAPLAPVFWELPVSDEVSLIIPPDAQPGTYVAALKARRLFAGEALNRVTTIDVPVGTATPTEYVAKTGPCNTCHSGPSAIANVLMVCRTAARASPVTPRCPSSLTARSTSASTWCTAARAASPATSPTARSVT